MDIGNSLDRLLEYNQERHVTAMIGFNSTFYANTFTSGENIWEELGIPAINILLDHPYWYYDQILMRTPANGIILCFDSNHMNYVNRFYPNISCNGFLPLGGMTFNLPHEPVRTIGRPGR